MWYKVKASEQVLTPKGTTKNIIRALIVEDETPTGAIYQAEKQFGASDYRIIGVNEMPSIYEIIDKAGEAVYSAKMTITIAEGDKEKKKSYVILTGAQSMKDAIKKFDYLLAQGYDMVADTYKLTNYEIV